MGGQALLQSEDVPFIDLNEMIARRYDELGPERVRAALFFGDERTYSHQPRRREPKLNAGIVVSLLRGLKKNPLAPYLTETTR